ncbi:MAG: iron-containing alcohol dehydrogenase [Defluviitaleaceae bacterium]|nr:iron-containing alcohol dehydrogenase [Defluviitaleaceae bacterium]
MGFRMYMPTDLIFGCGTLNSLHKQKMPGKKAMVAISNGESARANGYLARTEEQLKLAGAESAVFGGIGPNPLKSAVMAGAQFCRDNGCDFIVALGGGSVMDAAKAMALMATNGGDLWDYIGSGSGKGLAYKNAPLPLVTITTTAGTGSEVDPWGVITHDELNEKIGFGFESLYPVFSIVDPELMLTVPPLFTAFQGFDAFFHSAEVYVSKPANDMSDMYALKSISLISKYLARAVRDGGDIEAREKVALGNTLGGYAMVAASTTSQHSLEHALSAFHHELPHGAGLVLLSLAYMSHLIERGACDSRFIDMARAMGDADANKPADFIRALAALQNDCLVADVKMSDYGIAPSEFKKLAENAKYTMGGLFNADRIDITVDDCVSILKKSYK